MPGQLAGDEGAAAAAADLRGLQQELETLTYQLAEAQSAIRTTEDVRLHREQCYAHRAQVDDMVCKINLHASKKEALFITADLPGKREQVRLRPAGIAGPLAVHVLSQSAERQPKLSLQKACWHDLENGAELPELTLVMEPPDRFEASLSASDCMLNDSPIVEINSSQGHATFRNLRLSVQQGSALIHRTTPIITVVDGPLEGAQLVAGSLQLSALGFSTDPAKSTFVREGQPAALQAGVLFPLVVELRLPGARWVVQASDADQLLRPSVGFFDGSTANLELLFPELAAMDDSGSSTAEIALKVWLVTERPDIEQVQRSEPHGVLRTGPVSIYQSQPVRDASWKLRLFTSSVAGDSFKYEPGKAGELKSRSAGPMLTPDGEEWWMEAKWAAEDAAAPQLNACVEIHGHVALPPSTLSVLGPLDHSRPLELKRDGACLRATRQLSSGQGQGDQDPDNEASSFPGRLAKTAFQISFDRNQRRAVPGMRLPAAVLADFREARGEIGKRRLHLSQRAIEPDVPGLAALQLHAACELVLEDGRSLSTASGCHRNALSIGPCCSLHWLPC